MRRITEEDYIVRTQISCPDAGYPLAYRPDIIRILILSPCFTDKKES